MNEKNSNEKQELNEEQLEQATGAGTIICPKCKKTINFTTVKPSKCPYCGTSLTVRIQR